MCYFFNRNTLSPGNASPVTVRFMFSEDDQLSEFLSQYEEMEIPWSARVTEAERKYTIDGVATLNFQTGGVRCPSPTSTDSKDNQISWRKNDCERSLQFDAEVIVAQRSVLSILCGQHTVSINLRGF